MDVTSKGLQCCVCGGYFSSVVMIHEKYYCYTHRPTYNDQQSTIEFLNRRVEELTAELSALQKTVATNDNRSSSQPAGAAGQGRSAVDVGGDGLLKALTESIRLVSELKYDNPDDIELERYNDGVSDAVNELKHYIATLEKSAPSHTQPPFAPSVTDKPVAWFNPETGYTSTQPGSDDDLPLYSRPIAPSGASDAVRVAAQELLSHATGEWWLFVGQEVGRGNPALYAPAKSWLDLRAALADAPTPNDNEPCIRNVKVYQREDGTSHWVGEMWINGKLKGITGNYYDLPDDAPTPPVEFKPIELSEKDKEFIKQRENFERGVARGWVDAPTPDAGQAGGGDK